MGRKNFNHRVPKGDPHGRGGQWAKRVRPEQVEDDQVGRLIEEASRLGASVRLRPDGIHLLYRHCCDGSVEGDDHGDLYCAACGVTHVGLQVEDVAAAARLAEVHVGSMVDEARRVAALLAKRISHLPLPERSDPLWYDPRDESASDELLKELILSTGEDVSVPVRVEVREDQVGVHILVPFHSNPTWESFSLTTARPADPPHP